MGAITNIFSKLIESSVHSCTVLYTQTHTHTTRPSSFTQSFFIPSTYPRHLAGAVTISTGSVALLSGRRPCPCLHRQSESQRTPLDTVSASSSLSSSSSSSSHSLRRQRHQRWGINKLHHLVCKAVGRELFDCAEHNVFRSYARNRHRQPTTNVRGASASASGYLMHSNVHARALT